MTHRRFFITDVIRVNPSLASLGGFLINNKDQRMKETTGRRKDKQSWSNGITAMLPTHRGTYGRYKTPDRPKIYTTTYSVVKQWRTDVISYLLRKIVNNAHGYVKLTRFYVLLLNIFVSFTFRRCPTWNIRNYQVPVIRSRVKSYF